MLYAFHNNLLPLGFWNSAQVRLRRNVAPLAESRPNLFLELESTSHEELDDDSDRPI